MACHKDQGTVHYFDQKEIQAIPEIFAPDIISIDGRFEHGISFSPDAIELAFGVLDDDRGSIYYSKNVNGQWTEPIVFEPLKNKSAFLPYFTPDGKSLLYAQSKPDSNNLFLTDIWRIDRTNDYWRSPYKLKTPISTESREANACMTNDGSIYFSSNRNCNGIENCYDADLFYSNLTDNNYEIAKEISELVSNGDEESIFVSPNEDYLIFCRYTDQNSGMDLYISYQDYSRNWTAPKNLDSSINSNDWDRRPFVTKNNKFLFYTRLQIGEIGLIESDIYWVNTSKVFKPFVYNSLSDTSLQVGQHFEINIPEHYFKDINDNDLTLRINQNKIDWLTFDSDKMSISGLPTEEGEFKLTFTATDKDSNSSTNKVLITVKN